MEKSFNIPIVLFIYQRYETVLDNLKILKSINAKKIYLLADYNSNQEKKNRCDIARKKIEEAIDWDCKVIKYFAKKNIGVHANIGLGAMRVFENEEKAIFLEDDCSANVSFFLFCKEMLEKYNDNEKIIWINGTNYYDQILLQNNESYGFHQQLLPCGWASWSKKFLKYYDWNFDGLETAKDIKKIRSNCKNKALYRHLKAFILKEFERKKEGQRYQSWDFHMIFSILNNNLFGICPKYNLITNTGLDSISEHMSTKRNIMVDRFHYVPNHELEFPLIHPVKVEINKYLDKKIGRKILPPLRVRIKGFLSKLSKKIFGEKIYNFLLKKNIK